MSSTFSSSRRAPNVSQYISQLNTIPSAADAQADFNLGQGDLDFLTNTEFFDFDTFNGGGSGAELAPVQQKIGAAGGNDPRYQFSEFQTYPPLALVASPTSGPNSPPNGLQGTYPPQPPHALAFSPLDTGLKRKASTTAFSSPIELEDASRVAAEEDKRRRNTAASARFRVKKKQREMALEKSTKDMNDKISKLELTVQQLEMENRWLKGLITEKNGGVMPKSPVQVAVAGKKTGEGRSTPARKDGVGTVSKVESEDAEGEEEEE